MMSQPAANLLRHYPFFERLTGVPSQKQAGQASTSTSTTTQTRTKTTTMTTAKTTMSTRCSLFMMLVLTTLVAKRYTRVQALAIISGTGVGRPRHSYSFDNDNKCRDRSVLARRLPATFIRATSSSSSSRLAMATVPPPPTDELKGTAVKDSMSIVGDSIRTASFGDVQYWDTSAMSEYRVCFILGGPGAGKGTQSELMKQNYPCVHLSVGDLLRKEQTNEDSPNCKLIQECLVAGKIVPVEISLSLLEQAMAEAAESSGKSLIYLVDGFPRNYDNLDGWNRVMKGVSSVWGVLMYTCPLSVLEQRILSRAETSGRSDDNLKSAQKRFQTFQDQTVPLVDVFRTVQEAQEKSGAEEGTAALQVCDIKGDQTIDEVWQDTQAVLNGFIANDVWTANALLLRAVQEGNQELYESLTALEGGSMDDHETVSSSDQDGIGTSVSNASIDFVSGTKVSTSYDRTIGDGDDNLVRETRIWSHEGTKGWVNVHFSRIPVS